MHYQQQQQMQPAGGDPTSGDPTMLKQMDQMAQPLTSLQPGATRFVVKARITEKSTVRTWDKPTSKGQLFSFTITDAAGDQMKCTMFQEGVDKYFQYLNKGQVYLFSGGSVKQGNRRFNTLPIPYEITFDQKSEIYRCNDDKNIQMDKFSFKTIDDLPNCIDAVVDIIGAVCDVTGIEEFMSKAGKQLKKRTVTVADTTNRAVPITLWGDTADSFNGQNGDVVVFKKNKVGDFRGVSLSNTMEGGFITDLTPFADLAPRVQALNEWYNQVAQAVMAGQPSPVRSFSAEESGTAGVPQNSQRTHLSAISQFDLGTGNITNASGETVPKQEQIVVRGFITHIKPEVTYNACPKCNRKLQGQPGEQVDCDKCKGRQEVQPRYLISGTIADSTDSTWFTAFSNVAGGIFGGKSAVDLYNDDIKNPGAIQAEIKDKILKPLVLRIRVKEDTYEGNTKRKCTIAGVAPIDFKSECAAMAEEIEQYRAMQA